MNIDVNLKKVVEMRRSRRKYLNTPIEAKAASRLQELMAEYNTKANLRIELVLNEGKAFNGLTKSYGMLSGVNDYFGLITREDDPGCSERLGYYGELLVLHATGLGLGTCWVGGTFSRSLCPFSLSPGESLLCTIVVGNTAENDSFKERFIRNLTHRKSKSLDEMYVSDKPVPQWFTEGMKAVQKAPSAVNRQPVTFSFKNGKVSASVKNITDSYLALDLGIAKLHFQIGAGKGKWDWGNGAGFSEEE